MISRFSIALIVIADVCFSSSASQTDWSGGPGGYGPEPYWDETFFEQEQIEWLAEPGCLTLAVVNQKHPIMNLYHASTMSSADIDGDSDIDVLSGESIIDSRLSWFENVDGYGSTWIEHDIRTDFHSSQSTAGIDVNNDGYTDVVGSFGKNLDGTLYWFENLDGSGSSWDTHPVDTCDGKMGSLSVGDVDGDGSTDIVVAYETYAVRLYRNTYGTGLVWSVQTITDGGEAVEEICLADVDGDGDLDVMAAMSKYVGSGELRWFENADGAGTSWSDHLIDPNFRHACAISSLDFDSDGDCDVVASGQSCANLSWFENTDGAGTTWVEWLISEYTGPVDFSVGDFDADGDIDVAAPTNGIYDLYWYENRGGGMIWEPHLLDSLINWSILWTDDFNLDGCLDIATGAGIAQSLSWWDVEAYADQGELVSKILDTNCQPDWEGIDWNCLEPEGAELCFRVRSSDDPVYMGSWSLDITEPGDLDQYLSNEGRYFQYMLLMDAAMPNATPVLEDVTVTWNPTSIGGWSGCDQLEMSNANPIPAHLPFMVKLTVPETSTLEISVYDVSGRLVRHRQKSVYSIGEHDVLFNGLAIGTYLLRLDSGSTTISRPLVAF